MTHMNRTTERNLMRIAFTMVLVLLASTVIATEPAGAADPIVYEAEQDLTYYRCTPTTPPQCYKTSTLTFYVYISLGYWTHYVRGKTAITYGSIPWSEWGNKLHRMKCVQAAGDACGAGVGIPKGRFWAELPRYVTDELPRSTYRLRIRVGGCVRQFCGYGSYSTPPIYCQSSNRQCYFEDDL